MVGVGVIEPGHVPAAVLREVRDGVGAVGQQLREVLRAAHAAREGAAEADDRDRAVVPLLDLAQPPPGLTQISGNEL